MANIVTIAEDIREVLDGKRAPVAGPAFDEAVVGAAVAYGTALAKAATRRDEAEAGPRGKRVWASEIGGACVRRIGYRVSGTSPDPGGEALPKGRFLLGDAVEGAVVFLARAAGHTVEAQQERVEATIDGWTISGKRDAIIDGVSVDIKSASPLSFARYDKEGLTEENDMFGYRWQSEFYRHYGSSDTGVFSGVLFADKSSFALKFEPVSGPKLEYREQVAQRIYLLEKTVNEGRLPARVYGPVLVTDGKVEATTHKVCQYCEFRKRCFDGAATEERKIGRKKVTVFRTPPDYGY